MEPLNLKENNLKVRKTEGPNMRKEVKVQIDEEDNEEEKTVEDGEKLSLMARQLRKQIEEKQKLKKVNDKS